VSKDRFPKLKDFALKMHSLVDNTYMCESTFYIMKQINSKNRNRMTDETLNNSLPLVSTGIEKITLLPEKLRPHASHWHICNKLLFAIV